MGVFTSVCFSKPDLMICRLKIRLLMMATAFAAVVICSADVSASLMVPDSADNQTGMSASSSAPADADVPDALRKANEDTSSALGVTDEKDSGPSVSCVVYDSDWVMWSQKPQQGIFPLRTLVADPSPPGIFHPPRA